MIVVANCSQILRTTRDALVRLDVDEREVMARSFQIWQRQIHVVADSDTEAQEKMRANERAHRTSSEEQEWQETSPATITCHRSVFLSACSQPLTMSAWAPARASLRPKYRRKLPLSAGTTYVDDLVLGLCLPDSAFGRPGSKKYCSAGTPPTLISTLNPALLRPSDHLDFSHHEEVIIRFFKSPHRTYALFRYCSLDHRQIAAFSADCAGQGQAAAEGWAWMAACGCGLPRSSDPSSFEAGEDLRLPNRCAVGGAKPSAGGVVQQRGGGESLGGSAACLRSMRCKFRW
ncbi:hypothetical protein DFH08DRAFT_828224 [Mycena albidolilacea]|uniref:Uncharacterized protein n=1 Tax=Mycena albidolilacea TaxID=1033008 RepID=A0AAD6YWS6_9AGAR|nr:hypothetical protein DFH08DRAFT_828224 [Mycena albidolilacea]